MQKEQEKIRERHRSRYRGEAPKPIVDQPVWETGQGRKEWSGKDTPDPKRYYVIGKRPLAMPGGRGLYGSNFGTNKNAEHVQFIANDGSNRGLFPNGFQAEESKFIHQYAYGDDKRYNAELIDQAMKEVEKEMREKVGEKKDIYDVTDNNCQHYMNSVLGRAESLAKKTGTPFLMD
ncbi:hypothetical protein LJC26_04590 [Desulfovibrio sp. OttesenSCG-928-O18]|nr:hypothetical protein [Desulfovibrio sp. OttesenSCG-928-O18]